MNSMVPCRRPFYAGNLLPGLELRQVRYCAQGTSAPPLLNIHRLAGNQQRASF